MPIITSLLPALYFVRSGYINIANGRPGNMGIYNYTWSSSAASTRSGTTSPSAYLLYFFAAGINPSTGPDSRWLTFPLRCPPLYSTLYLPFPNSPQNSTISVSPSGQNYTKLHFPPKPKNTQTGHTSQPQKPHACVKNFDTLRIIIILYQPYLAITPKLRKI